MEARAQPAVAATTTVIPAAANVGARRVVAPAKRPTSRKSRYTINRLAYAHDRSGDSDQSIETADQSARQPSNAMPTQAIVSTRGTGRRPVSTPHERYEDHAQHSRAERKHHPVGRGGSVEHGHGKEDTEMCPKAGSRVCSLAMRSDRPPEEEGGKRPSWGA